MGTLRNTVSWRLHWSKNYFIKNIHPGMRLHLFEQMGFKCTLLRIVHCEQLPMPREKLDSSFFSHLSNDDLLMSDFDILLKKF